MENQGLNGGTRGMVFMRTWINGLPTGWGRDLRLAAGFLTRIPVTVEVVEDGGASFARSTRAFPLVGAGIGLAGGAALMAAAWLGLGPLAVALLALATMALITGALHEDGLADVADGFGGGRDRAAKLAIMRDSRIGAYGVLALVLVVGLKAALIAEVRSPEGAALAVIAAAGLSRALPALLMNRLSPARTDGLGAGAGRPAGADAFTGLVLGGGVAVLCLGPVAGPVALAVALATTAGLGYAAQRQIGGQTGDVLGAAQQVAEVAVLAAAAAVPAPGW